MTFFYKKKDKLFSKRSYFSNLNKKIIALVLFSQIAFLSKAATFTVSNTNDSGAGSLRQAIIDANASPGADVIQFSTSGLLTLLSALPNITGTVDIQGETSTGYVVGTPTFQVHSASNINLFTFSGATSIGSRLNGLNLSSTGARTAVGVLVSSSDNITVTQCWIRTRNMAISISNSLNSTVQNCDFTNSGADVNNPQVFLTNVSGIVAGAITGNTWGGTTECLLRLQNISQNLTVSDGSVAGSQIAIQDGSVLTANLTNIGIYVNTCTGSLTFDNIDLSKTTGRNGTCF